MESVTLAEATTGIEPIPSYRPDEKTRRYDRQLRLWASAGQKSLEQARILLIGADATGCQSLKNLVLPGISHFTVVSDAGAQPPDIATNFFLVPDSMGLPIAEETTRLLKELNPSVEGCSRQANPSQLLKEEPEFFLSFTMILSVNSPPDFDLALSDLLWSASSNESMNPDIPLIVVRNSGFIGKLRLQYRQHCIVDTHAESAFTLRLDRPFQALSDYAKNLDMESMDSMEHSHVPYAVLLVRALERFKAAGHARVSYDNLDAFKETLMSDRRALDEENFEEAEQQAFKVTQTSEIPDSIKALFASPQCNDISPSSRNFWLLVHALKQYTLLPESEGLLPISASLPDMKASTKDYVHLQGLYKDRANGDLELFSQCLEKTLRSVGLDTDAIDKVEVNDFVKNCHWVLCIDGRSLREESETDAQNNAIAAGLSDEMPANYYLAFKVCERFHLMNRRWPLSEEDVQNVLQVIVPEVLTDVGCYAGDSDLLRNAIREIMRGGFGCLPTTSAFIGGIVAQEAIKLITAQYIPLDNTCIIDLVKSSLEKYRL
ncbi:hypothetical protein NliqN6_1909 [Naganishia liquefaciens]|uniref:NEDD8-activating enzyme E1 regulatory subunit n=1 Tax=Naganishia liquefaciens TaxID=104408 RepID=A0A8H3TQT4_9TREE|nr:hypothetical protein NliqN6_1909 [Naganishia liquefaciens]